jgi:hypothetical protein
MKKYCPDCSKAVADKARETKTRIFLLSKPDNEPMIGIGICSQCAKESTVCYVGDDEKDCILDTSEMRNIIKHRIAPGIWIDMDNGLHIAVPEICAHLGLDQTEENHAMIVKMAEDLVRRNTEGKVTVEHRKTMMD